MRYIDYTMPLFKKAVKRNEPKVIHLTKRIKEGYDVYEFWFVTQKAVVSFFEPVMRSVDILKEYLIDYGYSLESMIALNDNHLEFVRYE